MNTPLLTPAELKAWRARLGISQTEAETRVFFGTHYSGRHWRRWENGEHSVPRWLTYIRYWLPDLPAQRPGQGGMGTGSFGKGIAKK